jgi:hypothetical protein
VFAHLPTDVDVAAALSSAKSPSILLGELPSIAASNWRLALEDFGHPERGSHLALGAGQEVNGCFQWPLIRLEHGNTSSMPDQVPSDETREQTRIGRLGTGPSGLELVITSSADPDLIEHLSCCILVIEKDSERHCIQLRKRQIRPPLQLVFQRAKEEILLDAMPTNNLLASDRIMLEVLGMELDGKRISTSSDLRAGIGEELAVILDAHLQCEIGMRLCTDAEGLSVVVWPRYTLNDRKQGLVAKEVEKDLARAKSQLARNQRDLIEAQLQLKAIPKELDRISKITPGSPQESVYLQSRLALLRQTGSNLESTVRRIMPLLPRFASDIEQMERVLSRANEISKGLQLDCRVVARGDLGELVLFEFATNG